MFDKFFGKGKTLARARAAEERGEVARAAELYAEAGQGEDAARMFLRRAEGEVDPRKRLPWLVQAAHVGGKDSVVGKEARRRRASLLIALAGDLATTALARHDLIEAAAELEAVGAFAEAAEAFGRAGDKAAQARALEAGGEVEALDGLLAREAHDRQLLRGLTEHAEEARVLEAAGQRREALAMLERLQGSAGATRDPSLTARVEELRSRKVTSPLVHLQIAGQAVTVVLGEEVVVGRSEGNVLVPSSAVSRAHVRIFRRFREEDGGLGAGDVVVRDLDSRNGTLLRGHRIGFDVPIEEGIDLSLGGEVPLRIEPSRALSRELPGAVAIHVGGRTLIACLGPTLLRLGDRTFSLHAQEDRWVELRAEDGSPLYADAMALAPHITLLVGDALSTGRAHPPALRVTGEP